MHADGLSYRLIVRNVGVSKNTVMDIIRRNTAERSARSHAAIATLAGSARAVATRE